MTTGRAALLLALLAGTAACQPPAPTAPAGAAPAVARIDFTAFGSPVSLQLAGADPDRAQAAVAGIQAFLAGAGRDWYAFGDGELARVNAALAAGEPAPVSPELAAIIGRALDIAARSGGRFDPAVGDLVTLWGFDRAERLAATLAPPPEAIVTAARAGSGTAADVTLADGVVRARRPLRLDLGGIAKGTAVARIGARLAAAGIDAALVDLGGSSLLALGTRGDRPWRAGLRHPRRDAVFATLALAPGESLATSGDYERAFKAGGRSYGHVLDPRTGAPATGAVAATVVSPDPELADAAATALLVGGPAEFDGLVERLGVPVALLVTADGRLVTTPAMAARLAADNGGRIPPLDWPAVGE
jgi:thiamine biosynthesis lipoprotein